MTACATAPAGPGTDITESLELRLAEQKKQLDEANNRIDELSIKFSLLQEKLVSGTETTAVLSESTRPPAHLKVIELNGSSLPVKVVEAEPQKVLKFKLGKNITPSASTFKVSKGKKSDGKSVTKLSLKKSKAKKPLGPKGLYSTGQNLFLDGRYEEARKFFSLFLASHPSHSLADNALYWQGEAFYSEKQYKSALNTFLKVIELYPNENKAPDALLKVGYSYIELDDYGSASRAFKRLASSYPDSVAVSKADRMLKSLLKQEKEGSK